MIMNIYYGKARRACLYSTIQRPETYLWDSDRDSVVKLAFDVSTIQYHKNRKVQTEVPAKAKFVL